MSSSPECPPGGNCNLCGGPSSLVCPSCDNQPLCDACDDLFHRHPSRANHKRDKIPKTKQGVSHHSEPQSDHVSSVRLFLSIIFFLSTQRSAASVASPPSTLSAPPASRGCVRSATCFTTPIPSAKDTRGPSPRWPRPPGQDRSLLPSGSLFGSSSTRSKLKCPNMTRQQERFLILLDLFHASF